jgi:aryl-phospho-beta-D-glucosidase BglC (GH1 family)
MILLGAVASLASPCALAGCDLNSGSAAGGSAHDMAPNADLDHSGGGGGGGRMVDAGRPNDGSADGGAMPDGGTPLPTAFAHVDGDQLLDGANQPLLLRSMALGNWLEPEGYMWNFSGAGGDRPRRIEQRVAELIGADAAATFWKAWHDNFVAEDDIAKIHDLGFNAVRVAMNARLLLPEGQDSFDQTGFSYLTNVVDWAGKHGVYVILDMHTTPGGQTGANIDDSINDQPDLFNVPSNQDRLVKLWTEVARRFAANPTVLGYDLLNEPLAPDFSNLNDQLWPLYQRLGAAIRTVDSKHIFIVEGAQWANNWSSLQQPFDDQLIYSFHKYWDDTSSASIQGYLDSRGQWKKPLWCGETGENNNDWYKAVFPMLESNQVGWSFWTWKKLDSGNNPYAIPSPANWGIIQAYVSDQTQKPSAAAAQAVFDELVQDIRLANCSFNRDVVCSIVACH